MIERRIVRAELCVRSWFGHPEGVEIGKDYSSTPDVDKMRWTSPLACWRLQDEDYFQIARAFEPTEKTPRWVFTDGNGDMEIEPPISMDQLRTLMVLYRMKGGPDVDTLHL
jgi:hypothetical protein